MLDVPLGTVPEFDPELEPYEAVTVIAFPGPATERVTPYLPIESELPWRESRGEVAVTCAPLTAFPLASKT